LDFIKKCGIMLEAQEGMSVSKLLEIADLTERLGFGYLCRSDHLMDLAGRKGRVSSECWVTFGAIAARTKSLKFGPLVSPVGFRNPAVLARMAWTLHSFVPGRFQLGVGSGWYEDEYRSNGLEFPSFRVRDEQFAEALQIIRPFTQGEKVDFHGKYFSAHMEGHPKRSGKIHLVVGGRAPRTIRKAAQYADEWNTYLPLPEKLKEIGTMFDSVDRDIQISQMGPFVIAENEAELRRKARVEMRRENVDKDPEHSIKELRRRGLTVETAKNFAHRVNERREAGIDKFYFRISDTDDMRSVELLAGVLKDL